MRSAQRRYRSFWSNSAGGIAALWLILLPSLLLVGGIGIDLSQLHRQRLLLQGQADLAAQAAARRLPSGSAARLLAQEIVLLNTQSSPESEPTSQSQIRLGQYSRPAGFTARPDTATDLNAIEVVVSAPFEPFLIGPLLPKHSLTLSARALALGVPAPSPLVAFSLRNRLLGLETQRSALNRLLTPLGLNLALSALDVNALAASRISLDQLLRFISLDLGLGAASFETLLQTQITIPRLLTILRTRGYIPSYFIPIGTPPPAVTIGSLLQLPDTLVDVVIGDILPDISLNMLDLLGALAALSAGAQNRIALDLSLDLGPVLRQQLDLRLVHRARSRIGRLSEAPRPALDLSQGELRLYTRVAGGLITIRLELTLATARAELTALNCAAQGAETFASFNVTTTPISLRLQVSAFEDETDLNNNTIYRTRSQITPLSIAATQVINFTRTQADNPSPTARSQTVSANLSLAALPNQISQLLNQLKQDLDASRPSCNNPLLCGPLSLYGILTALLNGLTNTITTLLNQISNRLFPLDTIVTGLLQALGISVASAELILDHYDCGANQIASSTLVE